jgi:hypothetical protein
MKKRYGVLSLVLVFMLVFAGVAVAKVASSPVSAGGVIPKIIDGANPGGNRTCAEVGLAFYGDADYYKLSSEKVDYKDGVFQFPDGYTFPFPVSIDDGTYVSWGPFAHSGLAAIVKGGDDANVYVYDASITSDSRLASPLVGGGPNPKPAGLSNLTFCWNPAPVEEAQWCSPGYWRQPHHVDSWAATGISPDDLFYAKLGYYPTVSKQGQRAGAPTDPTLLQVLQAPQWYGGDAFNAVGDLLSDAHPDVNFTGERVEGSCPLN